MVLEGVQWFGKLQNHRKMPEFLALCGQALNMLCSPIW